MSEKIKLPRVDLTVTTYNRPKSLLRLLDSIKRQRHFDFSDFSVQIVNDRSRADYPVIEGKYPFEVKFIQREGARERPEPYSARNVAVNAGQNEIIVYLGDDCILGRHFVYLTQLMHASNKRLIVVPMAFPDVNAPSFSVSGRGLENHYPSVWVCGTPGISVRRKWVEKVGGYDEQFDGSMGFCDVEFAHRLFVTTLIRDVWIIPGISISWCSMEGEHKSWRMKIIEDWRKNNPDQIDPNYQKLLDKWPDWIKENG